MAFRIVLTARAIKNLETIEPQQKNRIGKKLKEYANNPFAYAKKLVIFRLVLSGSG